MLLPRRAGKDGERPAPGPPPARETQEPATDHAAREVLLRHGGLAALPAVAELVQVGQQRVAQNRLERERGEHPVEEQLRERLVVGVQSCPEVVEERGDRATGLAWLVLLLREAGGLGCG